MPSPPQPQNSGPLSAPERFNPAVLDRSIIATPLLDEIKKEKELIEFFRAKYPDEAKQYNSIIFLPEHVDITSPAVMEALQKLIDEAVTKAESGAAKTPHRIGDRFPGRNAVFAWLDARTVQWIVNRQKVWQARRRALPLVIEQILPTRFKVIIDLNLEFVGQRRGAYDWVKEALALAWKSEGVNDPGQAINEDKSEFTDQYVFATVEADVISRLVEMDAEPISDKDLAPGKKLESEPKRMKGAWVDEL